MVFPLWGALRRRKRWFFERLVVNRAAREVRRTTGPGDQVMEEKGRARRKVRRTRGLALLPFPGPPGLPFGFSLGKRSHGPGDGAECAIACGGLGAEPPPPSRSYYGHPTGPVAQEL